MPSDKLEVRVSPRKLFIGLLLTVVPLALFGLFTVARTDRSLEDTIGTHFKVMAESTAGGVSQFIHDRVIDVVALGADPIVVDAATEANRSYAGAATSAIEEKLARIEKMWNTPAADPLVKEMLSSRASRLLNRHREADRRILRITLTDERGAAIAGTHKTFDYYQADEEFWQAIYASGRGAVSVTDILYDEVTRSNYIGIGAPIVEEGSNRFIGAIDALIDLTTMFPLLQRAQPGGGARTALVKEDGTFIYAPNVTLSMDLKSEEFAAIRDNAASLRGQPAGYLTATLAGGVPTLIGFADTGLKSEYARLGWTVLVAQDTRQAFAPIRGVVRLIAVLVLLGLLALTFLGVYMTLHRPPRLTDLQEVALAPRAAPASR
ncbi:MAG: cache domain-containing protein [Bryobacterales bacterium]|nr:cache domain-containing protein [Bryobacterales bacterium]